MSDRLTILKELQERNLCVKKCYLYDVDLQCLRYSSLLLLSINVDYYQMALSRLQLNNGGESGEAGQAGWCKVVQYLQSEANCS